MDKKEFLERLDKGLSGIPENEREERLNFYAEMIEDRMEEGLSQEEAVSAVGDAEQIISQVLAEFPQVKPTQKAKRKWKAWEILLLALGSPIWLSLLIAAFAVILAMYVSLWAVVVSLWAVFGALLGCGVGVFAAGILLICRQDVFAGVALMGAGLACTGLGIFAFWGCRAATKGMVWLTKKPAQLCKHCFVKREEVS